MAVSWPPSRSCRSAAGAPLRAVRHAVPSACAPLCSAPTPRAPEPCAPERRAPCPATLRAYAFALSACASSAQRPAPLQASACAPSAQHLLSAFAPITIQFHWAVAQFSSALNIYIYFFISISSPPCYFYMQ